MAGHPGCPMSRMLAEADAGQATNKPQSICSPAGDVAVKIPAVAAKKVDPASAEDRPWTYHLGLLLLGRSASNPGNKSKIFTILGCWFLGLTIILCIPITYLILNPPADELPSNATALDMTETPSNATVFYGHEKENADGSPKQLELLLFDPAGEHSSDIEKHRVTRGVAKFAGKALGIMLGVILFIVLCAICGCCLCCFKVHRIILGKHKEHQVQGHRASLQYMVGNGDGVYSGQGAQPIYPPQQGYQPPPPPYQAHNNQGYGSQNPYPNQTQYSNNYPNNQPSAPIGFEGLQR